MSDPQNPSRPAPMRRLFVLGLVFVAAILSCGKDVTGPLGAAARYVRGLAFEPVFPPAFELAGGTSSGLVQFSKVHVVLHHSDGTVALDTTIDYPADSSSITLDLTVKLLDGAPPTGESMNLDLDYVNASGQSVFHGGPVAITAAPPPASGPNPPVQVPVSYTGPGATATAVVISPRTISRVAGQSFSFSAIATDASGATLANTPIIWNSLDPSIAAITAANSGAGIAGSVRGTARITAQLLTGQLDQVTVVVTLPAANFSAQGGSGQTGVVGTTLTAPLVVKVAASDGVGVAGYPVSFAVASGGGSVGSSSVVTDANGLASTSWKLGTTVGAQSVTVSAAGLTGSPVSFGATATAASATQLVITSQPTSGAAGSAPGSVVVTAEDANGNIATTFTSGVSLSFGTNTAGGTLSGATTVNAVLGVAAFSGLAVNKVGTGYTLVAGSTGLTSATTGAFDITPGAPNKLVFTGQPSNANANNSIGTVVVAAQDAQGNPTPAFAGTVSIGLASNPGHAALSGTITAGAVAGIATFSGLTLNVAGTGYALSAASSGLASATSSAFNITGGVATNITLVSGGGQTGAPSAALAQPIVIKVADALGNGIPGTQVNFAVVTGGGSVSPTIGTSDAAGHVQTTWTLGPGAGAQSISATAGTLTNSPLTINATAVATTATQLVFTTQPITITAGTTMPAVVVTAKDALNNTVATFTGNVALTFGTNPGGLGVLNGTSTVAAVAGVATFNTLSINHAAAGYTLNAASGTLTAAVSNAFAVNAVVPGATIAISAGNGQAAATSTLLPTPLAVLVTDAFANPVQGTTVNWAAVTGGGSVGAASSVTNAAGVATTTWTLGATAGVQTASATSGTLAGSPLTFTANASTALANKTWTGVTNNQWAVATNWSPVGVPVGTDSVLVPFVTNLPMLSASTTVASLYIASSASVNIGAFTLTVNGELDATGPITGGGSVSLGGAPGRHLRGVIGGAVTVGGTYAQNGTLTVTGNVVIGSGGALTLNGNIATISGSFSTTGTGTITMTSGGDVLSVVGAATFSGGAETGLLAAGTISVTGNFTQSTTAGAFAASGNNTVVFTGTTVQTVTFSNTAASNFQNLNVANPAGVAMATSGVVIAGNVIAASGGIAGAGSIQIGGTLTDGSGLVTVNSIVFSGNAPVSATTPTLQVPIVRFTGAAAALAANLTVNGKAIVDINGVFSPNGHTLTTTGNFETQSNGKLSMTGASDAVVVQSNAIFGGGSTAALLTNGTLTVFGDFSQTGATSTSSFQAVAPHLTLLNSNFGTENISFANPDTVLTGACTLSCFGNFTISKTTGTVTFNSPASVTGNAVVNTGVTAVNAIGTAGNPRLVLVKGSTTTAVGTNVHITRFGTFGSLALNPSATVDTMQFHGTAAQVIGAATYNEVVIKGSPTVGTGGFTTNGGLTVDGGVFTLGGQAVSVTGAFLTTHSGTLVMNAATDSLLVVGQATFSGGVETGLLTNGTLFVLTGITVSGPSQFNATGNHVTYLVGPDLGCGCTDIQRPPRGGVNSILGLAAKKLPHARLTVAALAARRAAGALGAKDARAKSAALQNAHKALASKWATRVSAVRAAIAGRAVRAPAAGQRGAAVAASTMSPANVRIRPPGVRSSTLNVVPQSSNPITVSFGDSTSNQFANLRVIGSADWQTFARVAGKVHLDATTDLEGAGHIAIGDTLFGVSNSNVEMTSVELFGVLADTGFFEPDTTVFSGALQTIPKYVGSGEPSYNNVVVNSAELDRTSADDEDLEITGSLFIMNSGQLRVGVQDSNCDGCESGLYVDGNFETHNAGVLRMNDVSTGSPLNLVIYGNALFAGGSTTGLLTQGEIDYYANFTQSGPTTDSHAATSPHYSYFGASSGTQIITFANPAYGSSHFGDLYLGDPSTTLQSNMFVDGQLSFGHSASHTVTGTSVSVTSKGASVRDVLFDGVSWTLLDGYPVDDMDAVEFSNQVATGTQFTVQRDSGLTVPVTNWIFDTAPTGPGLYISATDTHGATNGYLTLNMSGTSPASNSGKVALAGGAVLNGWFNLSAANWLGVSTDWNSTANWNTGVVPNSGTDVTINCDCSAPSTTAVSAVHNLTMGGTGIQLTLGAGFPLTVNGDLSIASGSNIAVGSASITLLGNVSTSGTGAFDGITCTSGTTGAIVSGAGTHSIAGKFCRLAIAGTANATGRVLVKNTTAGAAGLTIQGSGSLAFGAHAVETDSMYTTGSGTISMIYGLDSLIIHGANVGIPVSFAGGSETGLMTAGVVDLKSPGFSATGTSFDATGTQVFVVDSNTSQNIRWVSPVQGHGFNNAVFKYPNFKIFGVNPGNSIYFNGSVVLDPTMGPSGGQLAATGVHLYFGSLTDNSGIAAGAVNGAFWLHLTSSASLNAPVQVDSLFFESGGNMQLTNNLTFSGIGGVVIVRPDFQSGSNTGLLLNGHLLKTTNHDFITTGTAFLSMTNSADSVDVGTASVFFNGGDGFGTAQTKGGIAAGGFYQGYWNTTTLATGAAADSYNPTGTHRIWLTGNSKVIFANPGTGASLSHFNSMHNSAGFTTTLYSDVFVDDSLYLGSSGISIASDGPTVAGKTRLLTTQGLGNNTTSQNASFSNVSLKWVDGQTAPTNFDGISWTNFPLLFSGTVFEVHRSTSAAPTFASHSFLSVVLSALIGGGTFVNNSSPTGGPTLSFTTPVDGLFAFSLSPGTSKSSAP